MDTRSKKFDRTFITKPVAFLLAVLLAVFACVYTLRQALFLEQEVDGAGVYVSDFLRGFSREDVTKMYSFANENRTVQETALQRYLFGDGSKKAYEAYKKNYEASHSGDGFAAQRKTILANCAGESGHGSPTAIFGYLMDDLVTLRRLGSHEAHFVSTEMYADESGIYLSDEENLYDQRVYRYNQSEDFDEDYTTDAAFTTMLEDVTNAQGVAADAAFQSTKDAPKEIQKQLRDGEIAVELCRTHCVDGNTYDGYYALSVDERTLAIRSDNRSKTNYADAFKTYELFQSACANAKERAGVYQNMLFAVVDGDTGKAVSNVSKLDGKVLTEKDLQAFTQSVWNYRIDLLTGSWTGCDRALDDISDNAFLRQSMTWFLSTGEVNGTLYVTFDPTLAKPDPFSEHLNEYAKTAAVLKDALKVDLLCLLGILVCTVYLVIRAGRRAGDGELRLLRADKIFTLLRTVLNLGAAVGFGGIAFCILEYFGDDGTGAQVLLYLGIAFCASAITALLLDWLLYLARHIKNGTLLKNFFAVWLLRKGKALFCKIKAARAARAKPVRDLLNDILRRLLLMGFVPNFILGFLIVLRLAVHPYAYGLAAFLILLIFAYDVFLAGYICVYAYHLRTVIAAVKKMREGELHVAIDTAHMPPAVKAFADDVTRLQQGLQTAVEQAIRDERTKTELITNVSHDLKTPLTSIINYVDLLSRCEITDPAAKEYLQVLGEKSDRLKKLIEDLVEASKASAGAVSVELTTVSLNELCAQLLGEYADEFASRELTVIEKGSEEPIFVRADGKLCCRVLDNLFGNIKKYAMPGTRVYLTLERKNGCGVLTLRNISEQPLDVSVDELRERFVRGDKSRSTEGSGLGLSIAEDLCRLQGASLTLAVDGDLFTASVAFASENDPPFNEI